MSEDKTWENTESALKDFRASPEPKNVEGKNQKAKIGQVVASTKERVRNEVVNLAEISKGIASRAIGKLGETLGKIKPETRGYIAGTLTAGALAVGGWYLVGTGIDQSGGLQSYLEIVGQAMTDILPAGITPLDRHHILQETVSITTLSAFATGLTAFLAGEAYKTQKS